MHLAGFARMGFDVEGVELSGEVSVVAAERLPRVRLHQADMGTFRLDFRPDRRF